MSRMNRLLAGSANLLARIVNQYEREIQILIASSIREKPQTAMLL